jgi:aminomethyltransferase
MSDLARTTLHGLHHSLGAKMTAFAGYDMPVQYSTGVMKEHLHCRSKAGLFDVSHMGQVLLAPRSGNVEEAARALETLVPASILSLAEGRQRYTMFTDANGGILDDFMVAHRGDHLLLVVNAACKTDDLAHLSRSLSETCTVTLLDDRALLALQGPLAERVLAAIAPGVTSMRFMDAADFDTGFGTLWVARS